MFEIVEKVIRKMQIFFADNEVFYIGGADVLPPPLEKEEEILCIQALSEENEKVDYSREEARKMLIEHNLRLVVYLAKKF